jgi:raffinose/stachyose/melibiose transport system permease protein
MVTSKKSNIISTTLIILAALIVFYPIVMMIMISLKTDAEYLRSPFGPLLSAQFSNYKVAYDQMNYLVSLKNSIVLTGVSAFAGSFLYAITAYAISRAPIMRKFFKGVGVFFWLGLALPMQVIMVPLVLWIQTLHLSGSMFGLIFVFIATNAAYGVFFFTGFVATVPISLEEAATIDGASPFLVLRKIVLPLLKTPMVTLLIIMILRVYNNFLFPLILLQGKNSRTLPLTIYFFKGDEIVQWNIMFAATTLTVLPLMIVYFLFQRNIIDGMLSGSVKQ